MLNVQREGDRLALAEYAPPGAIVDDKMNVIQVQGHTAPYLELSPGAPSQNLLKLAREGLIAGLGKAIRTARLTKIVAQERGYRIEDTGELHDVTIRVTPFCEPSSFDRYFLVKFEEARPGFAPARKLKRARHTDEENARLRQELVAAKEYLQIDRRRACHHPGRTDGLERGGTSRQ
ncbi:MAG: hypothetical protein WDO73_31760 [Ignavibacteriota bacterium]